MRLAHWRTAAGAAAVVLLGPALPALAGGTAPATCFGLAATITAPAGTDEVRGTEGDDVIVVSDVGSVRALGGADAVCVTGPSDIDAGEGNDRVQNTEDSDSLVVLGSGSDLFEGSYGSEEVYAERADDGDSLPGTGTENTDVIRTYGGLDQVTSGASSQPNDDDIDLGDGHDLLTVFTTPGGDAHVSGGPGTDRYTVWLSDPGDTTVRVDLRAATASVDGVRFTTLDDIEDVAVTTTALVEVEGNDGPNGIYVAGPASVDAGDGADTLSFSSDPRRAIGGPGVDTIVMLGYTGTENLPVVYDLARGLFTRRDHTAPFEAERLQVFGTGYDREPVQILGTSGHDVIQTGACGSVVRGGGGVDLLRSRSEQCGGRVAVTFYGGAGDDWLVGGHERDVLLGGAGADRARGGRDVDRCRAEIEIGCERD